ncbi:MAG: hypothetical protein SFU83_23130, partial [Meiothermus sp.]|nr:hypothetical protein [Meiothermus sp.]
APPAPAPEASGVPADKGSVTIQNWPTGRIGVVLFASNSVRGSEFAQGRVSADGVLTYDLSTVSLGAGGTTPTFGSGPGCLGSVTASPADWKTTVLRVIPAFLDVSTDPGGMANGFVQLWFSQNALNPSAIKVGDQLVDEWVYADRKTRLSGQFDCASPKIKVMFNADFEPGWNFRISTVKAVENGAITEIETTASRRAPASYRLVYQPR